MTDPVANAFRFLLLATACALAGCVVVWLAGGLPIKVHSMILIALAALFAISEFHFRGLLSDLNAILRRGGYSQRQVEELNQTIPPLRRRVYRLWIASTFLKAGVAIVAGLLIWDGMPPSYRFWFMTAGYSSLLCSGVLVFWALRNHQRMERQLDQLSGREVEVKEKKRLRQELASGESHNFDGDKLAKGYTDPATPIPRSG